MSIHSFQFMHVNSCVSSHAFQFLHVNSFMSLHSFQFIHVNSCMSLHSFQFIHVNSCVSIHAVRFIHVKSFMSIDSSQLIHFMQFISCQVSSFHLTMNSYKPYLFFETSIPARAGHCLDYHPPPRRVRISWWVPCFCGGTFAPSPMTSGVSGHHFLTSWKNNIFSLRGLND